MTPLHCDIEIETLSHEAGFGGYVSQCATAYQGFQAVASLHYTVYPDNRLLVLHSLALHQRKTSPEAEGALLLGRLFERHADKEVRVLSSGEAAALLKRAIIAWKADRPLEEALLAR